MDGKPRRILHVLPSFGIGGMEVRLARLIGRLGGRYAHSVVALDGDTSCLSRLSPGADCAALAVRYDKLRPLEALAAFRRVLSRQRPDLLVTYNWGSIEWAFVNRLRPVCPHIHCEDGFGPDEAVGAQMRRRVWFRRVALARSRRIVVPSRRLWSIAVGVWRLGEERVLYLPNGVDVARFAGAPDPADLPGGPRRPGELVVGTLSALRPEKNVGRLLRAFAGLGGDRLLRLVVMGDGAERPSLEGLARSLGIAERVVFCGQVAAPERLLGLLDVYAISSDTEQMPISLLEAMAAGLPVAAVAVGDVKEMLAPENAGIVVQPGDERGLREAMRALLADPAARLRLGQANRRRAERDFGQERMFAAWDRLFSE